MCSAVVSCLTCLGPKIKETELFNLFLKVKSDDALHFYLQRQYKYELFHINFTSFHCTGRYELNKLTSLPMCVFLAQLVEHRTGIVEVTGSDPVDHKP